MVLWGKIFDPHNINIKIEATTTSYFLKYPASVYLKTLALANL